MATENLILAGAGAAKGYLRLHAQTAMFENGFVLLPQAAHWLSDYVGEITSFHGARYDNQVDSTTQALDYLGSGGSLDTWARLAEQIR